MSRPRVQFPGQLKNLFMWYQSIPHQDHYKFSNVVAYGHNIGIFQTKSFDLKKKVFLIFDKKNLFDFRLSGNWTLGLLICCKVCSPLYYVRWHIILSSRMVQYLIQICCHNEKSSVLIIYWYINTFCEYLITVYKWKDSIMCQCATTNAHSGHLSIPQRYWHVSPSK